MEKILLAGEAMALMIAQEDGPLDRVSSFRAAVAGAEFNVAVGLARLGHEAVYLTRLGDDPFGKRVLRALQANGISTAQVSVTAKQPTGFMLKSKVREEDPEIFYFRKHSAASALGPGDVERVDLRGFSALHLTGILPALSATARQAARRMLERARAEGLTIFFDPNLRPQLWPDQETMVGVLNELACGADYVLPGLAEGAALTGKNDPQQIAAFYLEKGVQGVIVKNGKAGAYAQDASGNWSVPGYRGIRVVDTVGAGDGFAVGVVSAICEGHTLREAVARGNAIGAIQVGHCGDNEGLPTRDGLETFFREHTVKEGKI